MSYHKFKDEDGNEHGSFEVFYMSQKEAEVWHGTSEEYLNIYPGEGWYWAPGFIGCLWDGDPRGPFDTEAEAIADAQGA